MFKLKDKLKFINISQDYLKYLHDHCSEVYYKQFNYDNKPYLGILINNENNQYVIPLSSAKEKHKLWKNTDANRFLVYENCDKSSLSKKAIYKENPDGSIKHILSAIDLKKMIPVKEGIYSIVDLVAKQNDTTYIIKLRDDKMWSDGKKFTAEDVRFTIDRLKEGKSIYSYNES